MKTIAKWLAAISIIVLVVNITVLVAGDHVASALINGDYNISAGTFIAVISFVVRAIKWYRCSLRYPCHCGMEMFQAKSTICPTG